jgi:hypothetical protein
MTRTTRGLKNIKVRPLLSSLQIEGNIADHYNLSTILEQISHDPSFILLKILHIASHIFNPYTVQRNGKITLSLLTWFIKKSSRWIRCLFDPWDPIYGMEKKSRSGMNVPDLIFENLVSVFWLIMRIRDLINPGSGIGKNRIRYKHPGSATMKSSVSKLPIMESLSLFEFT